MVQLLRGLVQTCDLRYEVCISYLLGDPGGSSNGERLVITCEGNAGFYEAGMVNVPLGAGYSVIGWNHPGFWEAI